MSSKTIAFENSGLVSIEFPTDRPELLDFIKSHYPDPCCVMKREDIGPVGHERWYFSPKDDAVYDFIDQLKDDYQFKVAGR